MSDQPALTGLRIGGTTRRFLQSPEGFDGTLRQVRDGLGNPLPLRLSTTSAAVDGPIIVAGGASSAINNTTLGVTTPAAGVFTRVKRTNAGTSITESVAGVAIGTNQQWLSSYNRWVGEPSGRADGLPITAVNVIRHIDAGSIPIAVSDIHSTLYVEHVVQGAGIVGHQATRYGLYSRMAVAAQAGTTGYTAFVAGHNEAFSTINQGGIAGWTPGANPDDFYRGEMFGANDNARLGGTATFWRSLIGYEANTAIRDSATVFQRLGIIHVEKASARQAIADDAAFGAAASTGAARMKTAFSIGFTTTNFPISDGGTLIKTQRRTSGDLAEMARVPALARGIDFRDLTFSAPAIETPGFRVGGLGGITFTPPAAATLTTNGEAAFVRLSNTQLRVDLRGDDGVTRSTTLALS